MASSVKTRSPSALTGLRRGAFLGYRWLLAAFLLAGWSRSSWLAWARSASKTRACPTVPSRPTAPWGSRLPASRCSSCARGDCPAGNLRDHPVGRAGPAHVADAKPARGARREPHDLRRPARLRRAAPPWHRGMALRLVTPTRGIRARPLTGSRRATAAAWISVTMVSLAGADCHRLRRQGVP